MGGAAHTDGQLSKSLPSSLTKKAEGAAGLSASASLPGSQPAASEGPLHTGDSYQVTRDKRGTREVEGGGP